MGEHSGVLSSVAKELSPNVQCGADGPFWDVLTFWCGHPELGLLHSCTFSDKIMAQALDAGLKHESRQSLEGGGTGSIIRVILLTWKERGWKERSDRMHLLVFMA